MYSAMPWKCPACQTAITHDPASAMPSPNAVYRCHVCRLELVVDPSTNALTLAPLEIRDRPDPDKKFPL
jgi:hypothetical protein